MPNREEERELVRRARDGDNSAFDRLMAALEPDLERFLRGRLRSAPHVSVEEVLQEVRIYLFQRLDRYNPEYPVAVFARGLAANVVKRFVYRRSDLAPVSGEEEPGERDRADLSPLELGKLPLTFRRVLGEGRFPGPEGASPPSRTFLEVLEVFVRQGGYPHQQVAFGYSILLWGRQKRRSGAGKGAGATREGADAPPAGKVPVTGDPDRVVREVGPRELEPASGEMFEEVGTSCRLDAETLDRIRRPLDRRLRMTAGELFCRDPASSDRFRRLEDRRIGETRLAEYFGSDPRRSVSDWTHAVKNRVKKAFLDPARRGRALTPELTGARRS